MNILKINRYNGKEHNRICSLSVWTGLSPHTQHTTSSQYLEDKLDKEILPKPNSSLRLTFTGLPHLSGNCTVIHASGKF